MSTHTFHDAVAPHHRRIDIDAYDDVYVVGDVHGCRAELDRLLDRLALGPSDLVLFVGDLVRKGPDNTGVVDRVRGDDRLVSVRGNNEQKIIEGRKDPDWLRPGDREFFESLPVVVTWDGGMVVHGGVDPTRPLADHAIDDLLNMRSPNGDGYDGPFWYEAYEGDARVFFGHTVHDEPVDLDSAVGLDTGCVYGGSLTAYDLHDDSYLAIRPSEVHEDRSASKVVTPPTVA